MVALALVGFVLTFPWRGRGGSGPWPWVAAAGVYLVFLSPVLLSGTDTFVSYIKLDDTATWLAFTDHVLEYGRSIEGLAPSSHEAVIQINLTAGYPIGVFIPLAVGSDLTGTDPAWIFQPFLSLMAALMALTFYDLAARVTTDRRVRAAVVFVAAQPALLIGFAWWGGIKEIATAQVLALLAASVVGLAARPVAPAEDSGREETEEKKSKKKAKEKTKEKTKEKAEEKAKEKAVAKGKDSPWPKPATTTARHAGPIYLADLRAVLPAPIIAGSALIGIMGFGGMPWLFGIAVGVLALMAWRARAELKKKDLAPGGPLRTWLVRIGAVALGLLIIGAPTMFAAGSFFSPNQEGLTSAEEMGNLVTALSPAQYTGPWPSADFRLAPPSGLVTAVLVLAAVIAFAFGVWAAIEKRAAGLLILAGGTGLGSLIVWLAGSPWVQSKALATGTASFLLVAMVGIATLITAPGTFDFSRLGSGATTAAANIASRVRIAGIVLLVVPAGVLASNAMAFGDVWVGPKDQLEELERIGEDYAGQGPALMTEYHPHGVRHLLRKLDAEGASELRRRTVPLTDGSTADKGAWVDTDQLQTDPAAQGLFTYRTLVLRRSPQQSRPPTPYRLVEAGRFYEVWQLEDGFDPATLAGRLALGEGIDPAGVPSCEKVQGLAEDAGPNGRLLGYTRTPVSTAALDSAPSDWTLDTNAGTFVPGSSGAVTGRVELPATGRWILFLGGSTRGKVTVSVDGVEVGSESASLNNNGQYMEIGPADLQAGIREVEVEYEKGGFLSPGTRTTPGFPLGPLVFADASVADRLIELPSSDYRELCGKRLDWVEAYSG